MTWCPPDELLSRLKCFRCELYVSSAPIYGGDEGLLCRWCSSLDNKGCWRESGLELVVQYLVFPCKYEGCVHKGCGERLQQHEERCNFKNSETVALKGAKSKGVGVASEKFDGDIRAEMHCIAKGNKTTKKLTVLKYSINILCDKNQQLCLVNKSRRTKFLPSEYVKPIDLSIDGAVSLKTTPTALYCDPRASTLDASDLCPAASKCKTCSMDYAGEKVSCGFGHTLCTSCRGSPCPECAKHLEALSLAPCHNFGCSWKGAAVCRWDHEKNCTLAHLLCPFAECQWISPEMLMKNHLVTEHKERIHPDACITQLFTLVDHEWVMTAHCRMFYWKYYVYEDRVEFLVELIANQSSQLRYSYTFQIKTISTDQDVTKKYSKLCSIYNHSVLDDAISVPLYDIVKVKNQDLCIVTEVIDNNALLNSD